MEYYDRVSDETGRWIRDTIGFEKCSFDMMVREDRESKIIQKVGACGGGGGVGL